MLDNKKSAVELIGALTFTGFFILAVLGGNANADTHRKTYVASVAITEQGESWATEIVEAIAEAVDISVDIHRVPFKRSINLLEEGRVDFQFPFIKPAGILSSKQYDHSETTVNHVNFVLYSHLNSDLSIENLYDREWKISTEAGAVDYLDFPVGTVFSIEGALKMVDMGRLDGFIFYDGMCDYLIRKKGLYNIKRSLYRTYDVGFLLKKNTRGKALDKLLGRGVLAIMKNGRFKEIGDRSIYPDYINNTYDNWQPWQQR